MTTETSSSQADGVADPSVAVECHRISIVIPVYQGELTLGPLIAEIEALLAPRPTPHGRLFQIGEVILIHDGARDNSDVVMRDLAARHSFVRLIWLSRNFGQHPATLAGAASTTSEWVVTMDEDGDQNPVDIGCLVDAAVETGSQLVYGSPTNAPSHGFLRNVLSAGVKGAFIRVLMTDPTIARFNSFRLVDGEIARSLAAYCGYNVYLDVALSWVVYRSARCPVVLRNPDRRASGYSYRRLASHFWRLVLTSGTRPLRFVSLLGIAAILIAIMFSIRTALIWMMGGVPVQGWTSLVIITALTAGTILLSLGIIAEYLGAAVSVAMGRPLYVVISGPCRRNKAPIP